MKKRMVRAALLFVLLVGFILPVIAGEYTVFGPQRYERGTGKPATVTSTFASPVVGPDFTLRLNNGDDQGRNRVSSGSVTLNGAALVGPADFNQQVQGLERRVPLSAQNELSLQLASKPGSYLTVSVVGIDNIPPQLTISSPADGTTTEAATVEVLGTVSDQTPVTLNVNGTPAVVSGGTFRSTAIPLQIGENAIVVTAADLGGNSATARATVTRLRPDVIPPELVIYTPEPGSVIDLDYVDVSGMVKDESPVSVEVNGLSTSVVCQQPPPNPPPLPGDPPPLPGNPPPLPGDPPLPFPPLPLPPGTIGGDPVETGCSQVFSVAHVPLTVGTNTLRIVATDSWGNATTSELTVSRTDRVAPIITIIAPAAGVSTDLNKIAVSVAVQDDSPVSVQVNGLNATFDGTKFSVVNVPLAIGTNTMTVVARDSWGNTSTAHRVVTRKDSSSPILTITAPTSGSSTESDEITVYGTVRDDSPVSVQVNGVGTAIGGERFVVAKVPLAMGENQLIATATDSWGNIATATIAVTRIARAPITQPPGSFGAQYADLIPPDTQKTSYDPKRFSLITGEVKDLDNQPIPGVVVSVGAGSCVLCHGQEYGTVRTDATGRFTIPVEGGSTMTVTYQKPGLIASHRQVYVPWNGYAVADTIQMLAEDTAATTVAFDGNPATVMTHRSTSVTDAFGQRSATLVFTGDNKAYEVDAGGNVVRELSSITTRATEFVTPESMPANLPPTSAYTYCAEFSVDGVQRVKFAKPVIGWVDNFLGFDVGEIVPVGYYDRDRGVWVPSDNGRVVRLLDTDGNGSVDALDADGDNLPNDLNGNGSFRDEVKGLEDHTRYQPGKTFWRFSVTHFTPWDCNWPYGPPPDAIPPNPEGEPDVDQQAPDKKQPCGNSQINSFVEDRSRIFHEDIPIPGTDMTLHYASNRVDGYRTIISVPASGAWVPSSLKRIVVQVEVAGRRFERYLPPLPNQKTEFLWDGLDVRGRPIDDSITAQIDIGFIYEAVYYASSRQLEQSFAQAGTDVTGVRGRMEIITWMNMEKSVEVGVKGEALFAEGWSISDHHYLSHENSGILFTGDGKKIRTSGTIITTVAGDGNYGYGGDGGQAVQARLYNPDGMVVDAAGNLYIADSLNRRVRKVDGTGIISTVAGTGSGSNSGTALNLPKSVAVDTAGNLYIVDGRLIQRVDVDGVITTIAGRSQSTWGFEGDGGPAGQAKFDGPRGIAVDAAGNLYIADSLNHRVRKVDTAGIISTAAGSPLGGWIGYRSVWYGGFGGDGGLAVEAKLNEPLGLAVDTVGNLYIADSNNQRVRKVDVAGRITTVAGNGSQGYGGDGGPAVQAKLFHPEGVAVDAAGNLYISENYNRRVRKVDAAGIITTFAGNGNSGYSGDNGPAVLATFMSPLNVAVDAAGNLYIADMYSQRVRKVSLISAFAKYDTAANDINFIEENGLGHVISSTGLHKKTIALDIGATLRTFGYDANGNLITITDQFGNVTSINRDANGMPTAIVSPDGLTTQITIDANNHLTTVTYPDGSDYGFEYTPDGLMTVEIDPNGNRFEHHYDTGGKLTNVLDPEGGNWTYTRFGYPSGTIKVEKTTGEGNTTTYLDYTYFTGAYTSIITSPSGAETTFTRSADGLTETADLSCGMNQVSKYGLDAEYKTRFVKEQTEKTPSGKQRLTLRDRIYVDTNADKVPDRITDKLTLNGKLSTLLTDTLAAKREAISPLGRKVTVFYDPANLLTKRLAVAGLLDVTYGYDAKGRMTLLGQGERQTVFTYNDQGFLASVTDPEQRTTSYDTDVMGRVTAIHRPDLSSIGFEYDNNGNMTVLENPSSVPHGFAYNGNDAKTGYSTPQSGSYRYTYDKDRRLTETLFPSGRSIVNLYDKDRLAKVITPEGEITLNYLCAAKLDAMSKGGETISYAYDGKLVTAETAAGTLSQTLGYAYNNDFNVTGFTYAGATANFTYDNDGLLTGAGNFTIARDAANGLPKTVSGGAYSLSRSFSGYGEVAGETTAIGGVNRFTYSLGRSPAGRISAKTETVNGTAIDYAYSYDDLGRLTSVTKDNTVVEEYRYDAVGRRTYEMNAQRGIESRALAYSDEDHLLTAGDASYQYDLDGFLTTKTDESGSTAYTYSSRGELLKVVHPDGKTIEYVHDPQGRRIAKKVKGIITEKYLWQGLTRLLAVYNGSNALVMRFQYADGRMPVAMTKGAETYHLGYDQVGSLRLVVDASGNTVKQIAYDSFGNILSDSNPTFAVPFGFAGGLHDRDINLVRFGYRDYDPVTGRWTAKDPIGFAGGDVDLWGYCLNDPVNLTDHIGLISMGDIVGGIVTVATESARQAGVISPAMSTTISVVTAPLGDFISPASAGEGEDAILRGLEFDRYLMDLEDERMDLSKLLKEMEDYNNKMGGPLENSEVCK